VTTTEPSRPANGRERARARRTAGLIALAAAAALAGCQDGERPARKTDATAAGDSARHTNVPAATALAYVPPDTSRIPHDSLGASIRRGQALIEHTTDSLPRYAPGNIQCSNCHLAAGTRRDAAALIGVTARFPKYMDRSAAVISVQDRVNYCFTRSLAGTKLPTDSREMTDIVAYLAFISTDVPQGAHVVGEGMPKMPPLSGDRARGATVFAATCAVCHGADGAGRPPAIPALWGPRSFSVGASMAREERAASFIRHFMPQTNPGSLTDQQAFDVAAYVVARPRPDSPGKAADWPLGGAPSDVPYDTKGHAAYRAPAALLPRANASGAIVPPPPPLARR
jgi:thiosulfate dehydrogenase